MATLYSFEDLECWKTSQSLVKQIYILAQKEILRKELTFQDQLKRAALSIPNNIAEGFEKKSTKERLRFLSYARGSVAETKSMIYTALNLNFINQSEFDSTFALCEECHAKLKGFMRYLGSLSS